MTGRIAGWLLAASSLVVLAGCGGSSGAVSVPSSNSTSNSGGNSTSNSGGNAATQSFSGAVSGLSASGLILTDGHGDTISVPAGSTTFTMPTTLAAGASFSLTVQQQPTGMVCTVANGSGTVSATSLANVSVTCAVPVAATYTVGGTVSGLTTGGLVLVNGTDTVTLPANATSFQMPTSVVSGTSYNIAVQANAPALACTVSNGSGAVNAANVNSVAVTCTTGIETVLYSFSGASDGEDPYYGNSLLQATDGNLYGTTAYGGSASCGTVIKMTPAGVTTVLHTFLGGASDGCTSYGPLIQASDGNIYGTTTSGGASGQGTVFKITPAGIESILYSFAGGSDGNDPLFGVIQASDGNLYGTTESGGAHTGGTVFKVTLAGVESVLYSFANNTTDGGYPQGGLIQATDGKLYGLTGSAGATANGTVYSITTAGVETMLYSFAGGNDGTYPSGNLVQGTDGDFYGTAYGGANSDGVVFKVTPAGVETVLHTFAGGATDGNGPYTSSLIQASDGNFYGTTGGGGAFNSGTLFQMTPSGTVTVVWSFGGTNDAAYLYAGVIQGANGSFYGMSTSGGTHGDGAIFEVN